MREPELVPSVQQGDHEDLWAVSGTELGELL
jgi:hypothetical protein